MTERACVRCQKPIDADSTRRKFCSEACAYSTQRVLLKVRAAGERAPRRFYAYRKEPPPA